MKKIFLILTSIGIVSFSSCDNDDDSSNAESGNIELSGTTWNDIENLDDMRIFTFTSNTEYIYMERGRSFPGEYEFDGKKEGRLFESENDPGLIFEVENNILSVDQNSGIEGLESKYIKQ